MSFLHFLRIPTILIATAILMTGCSDAGESKGVSSDAPSEMDSLVTAEWLSEHLDDPDLVVLDCTVTLEQTEEGGFRSISGRAAYDAGHIPTAGFADLKGALSDAASPLQFAVPTPEQFADAMGALGIGDDTRVVLYDTSGSMWAARVWWMLRWIGFDRAALLDGGLNAWTAAGHSVSTESVDRPERKLTINLRPDLIADRDEVLAAIGDADIELIDSLSPAHYRGEVSMYARPGHIAGASNVPVFSALDESGRYRSNEELETLFGGDRDSRAITYCGGGIAASANAFVMTRLGFTDVAVYTASLQEWAADPSNPMEVTPATEEPGN
jgi:thiosulfate/3-mercaptopyruvate sulfurtransferase